jgi:hypothetical protein
VDPLGAQVGCRMLVQCTRSICIYEAEIAQSLVVCYHATENEVTSGNSGQRIYGVEPALAFPEREEDFFGSGEWLQGYKPHRGVGSDERAFKVRCVRLGMIDISLD